MSAKNVEILKDIMLGNNEQAIAILEKCSTPNSPEEAVELYYDVAGKLGIETNKDEVRETLEALAAEKRQQTEAAVDTMQQLDLDELENVVGGDDDYYNEKDVDEYGHDTWCATLWHCYTVTCHTESKNDWNACWSNYHCIIFNK